MRRATRPFAGRGPLKRPRVVVVGAGFGGLAAAIRLAAENCDVTLLERSARPGGRAGRLCRDGYRFDTGPSVLTMPGMVEELFRLNGERARDHLHVQRLDPAYRAVFHDGSVLSVRADPAAMYDEIRGVCGVREAERFLVFADLLRRLYAAEFASFIDVNFDSVLDLARPLALLRLLRLGGFRRVYPLVARNLSDWRLVRLFTFQSMYAGLSPFVALGIYAVIAYMDTIAGVYAVKGGLHEIGLALADLARRMGVDVRLRTEVTDVETQAGAAIGVRTAAGERVGADVVVINADLPVAYRDLLPASATPGPVRRLRYSPSCVVVHVGVDGPLQDAAHHNIHFAEEYRGSLEDLMAGHLQRDPSWFFSVPSVTDPTVAPAGGSTGFYLLPVPNMSGDVLNWEAQAPRERALALRRLESAGYGPVGARLRASEVVTPADWERSGLAAGTPFGASHTFRQTGPFRPRNVAPNVRGVVFAGSGTTPGVGVPMVLISGKLAAERVLELLAGPAGG